MPTSLLSPTVFSAISSLASPQQLRRSDLSAQRLTKRLQWAQHSPNPKPDADTPRLTLREYISEAWHVVEPATPFKSNWHIDVIADHLEAVARAEIRNLVINVPPRHGKSSIVSVFWPTWLWTFAPHLRLMYASYAESLSVRDALKSRRVIQSPWYQTRWSRIVQLTGDQNLKARYENTATGYRIATSVGGSATGEGGDLVVADDPGKVGEAESELEREAVLTWWDETMSTRLNDPNTGRKVIVMQRLHEQDLTGHVLERGNYHHLMLPAEYEPSVTIDLGACSAGIPHEPVRTVEGELLWPAQFNAEALTNLKIELGPYASAGQLQQSPTPRAGMLLDPADFLQTPVPLDPSTVDRIASIDLNYSSSESSDWTVAMLGAVDRGGVYSKIHIVDVLREHLSDAHHEQVLGNWLCRWQPTIVGIEKRAFEKEGATMDLCRRLMEYCQERGFALSVEPITVDTDKVSRAMIIPGRSKAGMMTADKRQPWWPTLSREMTTFPRGGSAHDDQIDALSMLVRIAAEKLERVRGHKALYGHHSDISYSEAQDPDTTDLGRLTAAGWR